MLEDDDKDTSTDAECHRPMIGLRPLMLWYMIGGMLMGAMTVYYSYTMRRH
jgi:hypothetical protein